GGYLPNSKVSYVTGDNFTGGYIATKHLLSLGRKKIGIITGGLEVLSAKDRYEGYIKALREAGIKPDERLVVNGHFKEFEGYLAMMELLKHKPDGVFAGNDLMAFGAIRAVKEAGLRIPGDLSVVGMDNIAQSELTEPPLTTVQYPIYSMGAFAAESIIIYLKENNGDGKNKNGKFKMKKIFDVSLVVRKST
ncbi:MAG: substrate-binding domain-containing protein, partial [Elusimicrobiota bacterium]